MKTAGKILIGILVTLLILFSVAEVGTRYVIAKQITSQVPADVSFGAQPVTLGLLGGTLPHVTLDTPGDAETPPSTIALERLHITQSEEAIAEQLELTTDVPTSFVRDILNQQLQQSIGDNFLAALINVSDVTTNPEANTFTIKFSGGAASLELEPVTAGDTLQFQVASTELLGNTLPPEISEGITDALNQGIQQQITRNMQVTGFEVLDDTLRVSLQGANVNLSELSQY